MMTVILGFCTFLARSLPEGDSRQEDVSQIARSADRAADVSRQLLAYSRRQLLQPQVLELNAVLADMESVLRRLMGEDREFVLRTAPQLGWVRTDRAQFEQVIINLALNARDAMPQGGRLSIETATVVLSGDDAHRHPGTLVQPGPYVMVAVSDTGRGMDAVTQGQIFEPFFTTKPVGHGTGLGLSTAYGIVKQSDGYIWVYSEPGKGTTFKIYLPRVESGLESAKPRSVRLPRARGIETILLVEDDAEVRTMIGRILTQQGYRVLEASDGAAALRLAEEQTETIHLLLTDVIMTDLTGRDLAKSLSANRSNMKVLFMSGYTDSAAVQIGELEPGVQFIQKPFRPDVLVRKIREVLDASQQAGRS
jgi:CheY-like chemotaxis protein